MAVTLTTEKGVRHVRDRSIPLVDEGLGSSAYLLDLGDGRALAMDRSLDQRTIDHRWLGDGDKATGRTLDTRR